MEKKKRGNPHPQGRVYTEMVGVSMKPDQKAKLLKAVEKYNKTNGTKMSLSDFVRMNLKDLIG